MNHYSMCPTRGNNQPVTVTHLYGAILVSHEGEDWNRNSLALFVSQRIK
jgi:hypothetical protein